MNNKIKYIMNIVGTGIFILILLGIIFLGPSDLCYNEKAINDETYWSDREKAHEALASFLAMYSIESLQPAAVNVLSYLTAGDDDGAIRLQGIFIKPNSIIAWFARINHLPFVIEQLAALGIIGPSLIIGMLFSWRVRKRAKALGFSKLAVRLWTYGTIFTGIVGYFTFMFTIPVETMVTCKNCGQLRRVEQDNCHNCKADWQMKHLKKADWRIISC